MKNDENDASYFSDGIGTWIIYFPIGNISKIKLLNFSFSKYEIYAQKTKSTKIWKEKPKK